jgi:hypothetical protein
VSYLRQRPAPPAEEGQWTADDGASMGTRLPPSFLPENKIWMNAQRPYAFARRFAAAETVVMGRQPTVSRPSTAEQAFAAAPTQADALAAAAGSVASGTANPLSYYALPSGAQGHPLHRNGDQTLSRRRRDPSTFDNDPSNSGILFHTDAATEVGAVEGGQDRPQTPQSARSGSSTSSAGSASTYSASSVSSAASSGLIFATRSRSRTGSFPCTKCWAIGAQQGG